MKNSPLIRIILLVLILSPFAWSGRLSDFEESSRSSSNSSYDSDDDDSALFEFIGDLLEALFSNDDPYYVPQTTQATSASITVNTTSDVSAGENTLGLHGWELQSRGAIGAWGEGFTGKSLELTYAYNSWIYAFDGTWDEEFVEARDTAYMRTSRYRLGVQGGTHLPFIQGLFGFTVLQGEYTTLFFSTRLAIENRSKYHGFRLQWDHDFNTERQGFHDVYGGAILKADAIQLDMGYRIRFTSTFDQQAIHGPQLGLTFRFGEWR